MTDETKIPDAASSADITKLVIAILFVIAGIAGYYLLDNLWLRWGSVVAGLVLGAVVVGFSGYGRRLWAFTEAARIELRKVVWPTRDETWKTTLAVFMFVTVAGVFFWVLDLVLAWATRFWTTPGGS
jgi:preprotein translocase subunit SecE